ncbi:hypothetical protein GCM10010442_77900 [Kitasatospora kifunensis]
MDVRVANSTDHKGLAMPGGHEIRPRRPVPRASEVGELGNVVDLHLVDAPAGLAPPGEEPGDQLLARSWRSVSMTCSILPSDMPSPVFPVTPGVIAPLLEYRRPRRPANTTAD